MENLDSYECSSINEAIELFGIGIRKHLKRNVARAQEKIRLKNERSKMNTYHTVF